MRIRLTTSLVALVLAATACSSGASTEPTVAPTTVPTTTSTTTTTLSPVTTTTTLAPVTTTTTTLPIAEVAITIANGPALESVVNQFYRWAADPTSTLPPTMPFELLEELFGRRLGEDMVGEAQADWRLIDEAERIAVAVIGDDVVLAAEEIGEPWRIVGGHFPSLGVEWWLGTPGPRHILIVGTDARPGYIQPEFRADSLHVIGVNGATGAGGIVGIPRDAWVTAPYGNDKITSVNALAGTDALVEVVEALSDLDIDGYVLTGFLGFDNLVDNFGGLLVDVPFRMANQNADAYISAGLQVLLGRQALGFARNRAITGGDFTRSFHQGVLIQAAHTAVDEFGVLALPGLIKTLTDWTWTDLALEDLFVLAASAFVVDPATVDNVVLPGFVRTVAGQSVVLLDEEAAAGIFGDLADGSLDD